MRDYTDIVPEVQRIKGALNELRQFIVDTYEDEDRLSVGSAIVRLDNIGCNLEDVEEICSVLADKLDEKHSNPSSPDSLQV